MKYIKSLVLVFIAFIAFATTIHAGTTNVVTSQSDNQWTFTLGGTGSTSTSGASESVFGTEFSLGHTGKFILPIEAGVRQKVSYATVNGGNLILDTSVYNDWSLFRIGNVQLLTGANVGVTYGNTSLALRVAPEVVGRVWLNSDVYAYARADYPFDLGSKSANAINYGVGLGLSF